MSSCSDEDITPQEGDPEWHELTVVQEYRGNLNITEGPNWSAIVNQQMVGASESMMMEHRTFSAKIYDGFAIIGAMNRRVTPPEPKFSYGDLNVESLMMQGMFSRLFRGRVGDKQVFIKQIKTTCPLDWIFKERDLLIHLKHRTVINLVGAFHDQGTYFLLESCFDDLQSAFPKIPARMKIKFAHQLIQGLEWIHSKNVIHCNICPGNVYINQKNNAVLGEFQKAQLIRENCKFFFSTADMLGCEYYSDTLALDRRIYGPSSDIFGAAAVMFEMDLVHTAFLRYDYDGYVPFAEYSRAIKEGRYVGAMADVIDWKSLPASDRQPLQERAKESTLFGDIICTMITPARVRPEAKTVLKHDMWKTLFVENGLKVETLYEDQHPRLAPRYGKTVVRMISQIRSATTNYMMKKIYFDETDFEAGINQPANVILTEALPATPTTNLSVTVTHADAIGINRVENIKKSSGIACLPVGGVTESTAKPVKGCAVPVSSSVELLNVPTGNVGAPADISNPPSYSCVQVKRPIVTFNSTAVSKPKGNGKKMPDTISAAEAELPTPPIVHQASIVNATRFGEAIVLSSQSETPAPNWSIIPKGKRKLNPDNNPRQAKKKTETVLEEVNQQGPTKVSDAATSDNDRKKAKRGKLIGYICPDCAFQDKSLDVVKDHQKKCEKRLQRKQAQMK